MNLTLVYAPADALTGAQLKHDLEQTGHMVAEQVKPGKDSLTLLVLSPTAASDASFKAKLLQALDNHQHIIPLMTTPVKLPQLINNLQALDFTEGNYPLNELLERIKILSDPAAPRPLTVLTPTIRKSNRYYGILILALVLVMFISGIVLVGGGVVIYPKEEYDLKETQRVDQRNAIIIPTLTLVIPHTTQDALSFDATVQSLPTRLQPFLAETATSFIAGSATPGATLTPPPDPR